MDSSSQKEKPAKKGRTPTARSLEYLRGLGWTATVVERRLPIPGQYVTQDAFGFGDILAMSSRGILLVQTTTQSNVAARIHKIRDLEEARTWLQAGGKIIVHGWAARGAVGSEKVWTVSERHMILRDGRVCPARETGEP